MNVRFAEPCRDTPLELRGFEKNIQYESVLDGRQAKDLCTSCEKDIYIGVFFDGTNNNKYRDTTSFSHSNVARLYEVYPGTPAAQRPPELAPRVTADGSRIARTLTPDLPFKPASVSAEDYPWYRKIYIPGVGTPMPDVGDSGKGMDRSGGLAVAWLGEIRLQWALLQLINQVHAAIFKTPLENSIDLSRIYKAAVPDATAFKIGLLAYQDRLRKALQARGQIKPALRKIRLSVFGFSRGATAARAWVNLVNEQLGSSLGGIPLQIDFLGIFDTVASVGLAQALPGFDGHSAWASGAALQVPGNIKRCVHLVAALEVRGSFPLDSVCRQGRLPANCKEIVYPGVHSDIGGGYPPNDQGRAVGRGAAGDQRKLSQIPLAQMYREARMAGVPLAPESAMIGDKKTNFAISSELRTAFNNYVAATRSGSIPPTQGKGDSQFGRMYPTETQPREELFRVMRRHYGILLRWRKRVMALSGGIAELPGLKGLDSAASETKDQDAQDLREAESELRKEIAFLNSADPKKFAHLDDPLEDVDGLARTAADGMMVKVKPLTLKERLAVTQKMAFAIGNWPAIAAVGSSVVVTGGAFVYWLAKGISALMRDKQKQWDTWLKAEWNDLDSADVKAKADVLFADYVHDSRAWFKAMLCSDGTGLAPNDEDWFVFGERYKAKPGRMALLEKKVEQCKKSGDAEGQKAAERELERLKNGGLPLIHGGREPYRMWGYVRHRKIYESGAIPDSVYQSRQDTIEKEEDLRVREQRRVDRIADENARHEKEIKEIKAEDKRYRDNPKYTSAEKDEFTRISRGKLEREMLFHKDALARIEKDTAATVQ